MHEKHECDHVILSVSEPYKVVYSYTVRVKEFSCGLISQEDRQETSPVIFFYICFTADTDAHINVLTNTGCKVRGFSPPNRQQLEMCV